MLPEDLCGWDHCDAEDMKTIRFKSAMIKRFSQLSTAFALLFLLGGVISPLAGSQTGDEWLHGEHCSPDGQGPVVCMDEPTQR